MSTAYTRPVSCGLREPGSPRPLLSMYPAVSHGSRARLPRFEYPFQYFLTVTPWFFCFLICKRGMIINLSHRVVVQIQ